MKTLLSCILLIISFNVFAQNNHILPIFGTADYSLNDTTYSFKELKPFFNQFEDTKKKYASYQATKTWTGVWAGIAITSFIVAITSDSVNGSIVSSPGKRIGILFGAITTTAFTVSLLRHMNDRPKIIDMYNVHFEEKDLGRFESKIQTELKWTGSSFGLVFSF